MCGFTGFLSCQEIDKTSIKETIIQMSDELISRGPDDSGTWTSHQDQVAFGFRRLSILDLSSAGHQPMVSSNNRYVICFNGEIYNHLELRELFEATSKNISWKGNSDTETILYAIEQWGIKKTLKNISGMFAISIWDKEKKVLTLARDRFGEKPLYYGWSSGSFIFGSQLNALKKFPLFNNRISLLALAKYLQLNYVPAPLSIFEEIFKLEPGCYLELSLENLNNKQIYIDQYWSLQDTIKQSKNSLIFDEHLIEKKLTTQLKKTIKQQMLSDVPLGAFLSGGIDSSLIVAIMQELSSEPIKTFTIGFDEKSFDESGYARQVAEFLGTDHKELIVDSHDAQEVIKKIPILYDEPFADSSQIPTYLVSELARKEVTVALSGDAGDEIFAGYNRYFWAPKIWNKISWIPFPLRRVLSKIIYFLPMRSWEIIESVLNFIFRKYAVRRLGDKAYKLADRLEHVHDISDLYKSLISEWKDSSHLIKNFPKDSSLIDLEVGKLKGSKIEQSNLRDMEKMMYYDSITYLPDDILCKVDRASMGVSLESRVPFLDPKISEIAWSIPSSLKVKNGKSKSILRNILYSYVPKELIERPKSGFGVPVGEWLRKDLKDWAEKLISISILEDDGIFHPEVIRNIWDEHLSGKRDWTHRLWSILMFQAWLHQDSS